MLQQKQLVKMWFVLDSVILMEISMAKSFTMWFLGLIWQVMIWPDLAPIVLSLIRPGPSMLAAEPRYIFALRPLYSGLIQPCVYLCMLGLFTVSWHVQHQQLYQSCLQKYPCSHAWQAPETLMVSSPLLLCGHESLVCYKCKTGVVYLNSSAHVNMKQAVWAVSELGNSAIIQRVEMWGEKEATSNICASGFKFDLFKMVTVT